MSEQDNVQRLSFPNGDFADGETGWIIAKDRGAVSVVPIPEGGGKRALRIVADKARNGAKVESPKVLCRGPGTVELRGRVCAVSGRHLGLTIREYDAAGLILPCSQDNWGELGGTGGKWRDLFRRVALDERTVALQLFFLAYPAEGERIDVSLDGLAFVRLPMPVPPYAGCYKIKPEETARLTAADVPGPDGIVYPDWRLAGVQGGIPDLPVAVRLEAPPEQDIADSLEQACADAAKRGGGAVLIGTGTYYLDRPVTIRQNGVVIRGSGRDVTRLVFRYSLVNPAARPPSGWPEPAVFGFHGDMDPVVRLLAADGRRGDATLEMESVDGLQKGDRIVLRAPDTRRWQESLQDCSTPVWGRRVSYLEIRAVHGNTLTISQPLRIAFPVVDGSCLQKLDTIDGSGVEDMTIEHACRMPFHTVNTHWAWNCWARRIEVIKCGRSGVHFHSAKFCEVRDCEFDGFDAAIHKPHVNWWGYAGFTQSSDCLMENTVWRRFRHGPQVQFGAQGNVIRNSVFHGSDAQWHAGWATENLYENCVIDARGAYGSYQNGAYATGSNDSTHGPNGPRNVVYNCDFICTKNGVMLNGVNENWLFLHNRFTVEKGAGFTATGGCFDHIIRNNRFILQDPAFPMLRLKTPDCVGIELIDNVLSGGNGKRVESAAPLAADSGNRVAAPGETLERPRAEPASIYAWQRGKHA
jgi:hypothetical protein